MIVSANNLGVAFGACRTDDSLYYVMSKQWLIVRYVVLVVDIVVTVQMINMIINIESIINWCRWREWFDYIDKLAGRSKHVCRGALWHVGK